MGTKTWMLVYSDDRVQDHLKAHPRLDRSATGTLASRLFPTDRLTAIGDGDLSFTCPPDSELHIGCFPGVSILAAKEFAIDHPSKLPERFVAAGGDGSVYLHAMHSAVDWFAYAHWHRGALVRSLSLSPDNGVLEDIGAKQPFEEPYWSGHHPAPDGGDEAYPLPFHPLELGEAALHRLFGYRLEAAVDSDSLAPESIPLVKYTRSRSWWRLR